MTSNPQPPKGPVRRAEATGIVIIATIVLIITLARYWHHIPWGAH